MTPKVMVVEDDFIIRLFIEKVLRSMGCEIVAKASSSDEAIQLSMDHEPDIIIMDIGIKGKADGIDTAKIIKEKSKVQIVFLTGNSDAMTLAKAKDINPLGFIFKPIDEDRLKGKFTEFIGELNKINHG